MIDLKIKLYEHINQILIFIIFTFVRSRKKNHENNWAKSFVNHDQILKYAFITYENLIENQFLHWVTKKFFSFVKKSLEDFKVNLS